MIPEYIHRSPKEALEALDKYHQAINETEAGQETR